MLMQLYMYANKLPYIQASGSGVILGKQGEVVTANHVIRGKGRQAVIAVTASGKKAGCRVVAQDDERDLAKLVCDGLSGVSGVTRLAPLRVPLGSRIVVSGYPGGLNLVSSDGIVANHLPEKGKLLLSALAGPGMSGGAVFSYDGALIGVIQAIYTMPPFTTLTTSNLQLRSFLLYSL